MIQKLKDLVELKYGKKISYQKDCKSLSVSIFNITGEQISSSTLRRFFGFLSTNSNPASVTLDILSAYCGFENWDQFQNSFLQTARTETPIVESWFKAAEKAKSISLNYCEQVKKTTPIGYNCTAPRVFAEKRMSFFLESGYAAMPFVGPGGFGKSTLIVSWFENSLKSKKGKEDITLLVPASLIESGLSKDKTLEGWILSHLGIDSGSDFFEMLAQSPSIAPGKLLVIIDSLDEISRLGYKCERLFSTIYSYISTYSSYCWFKFVVASRFPTWETFFTSDALPSLWYFSNKSYFSAEGANIPALNCDEIQEVLDNTLNMLLPERILVEEFSQSMVQIISYPYFLQVLVEIFQPDLPYVIFDRIDLLSEFLKKRLFQGTFSEEKADILFKIIELSGFGKGEVGVKKNDLKEIFPIHLKLAGNYYTAYNELLSFGMISEDIVENTYGVLTKFTRIPQGQLRDLLIVQRKIELEGGITFNLFKKIEEELSHSDLLPSIISTLFELAYKERNVEALKPFFTLPENTIQHVFAQPNVALCLRRDEFMRNELIPAFALIPLARKYLFENSIDINTINSSYKGLLKSYLKNAKNDNEFFFAQTLISLSGFLTLDPDWALHNHMLAKFNEPPAEISPRIAGYWFSCRLLAHYLGNNPGFDTILVDIHLFSDKKKLMWDRVQQSDFELGLVLGLVLSKQFSAVEKRLNCLISNSKDEDYSSDEKALLIHYEYAKWARTDNFDPALVSRIEGLVDELSVWDCYHTQILAKAWLSLYYLSSGDVEKAVEVFRKSIEISSISGYTIYEVKLLKQFIPTLEKLGEFNRAKEFHSLVLSLVDKKGFELGRF